MPPGESADPERAGVRDAALSKTLELPRVAQLLLGVEELFAEQSQRVIIEAKREVDQCA